MVLQLIHLRKEADTSWDKVAWLFSLLFPGTEANQFYRIRINCMNAVAGLDENSDITHFLGMISVNLNKAGEVLSSIGVDRTHLLGDSDLLKDLVKEKRISNEIVYELETFRKKDGLPWATLHEWINCFDVEIENLTVKRTKKLVSELVARYRDLQKSHKKSNAAQQNFAYFCSTAFGDKPSSTSDTSCAILANEVRFLKSLLEERKQEMELLNEKITVCKEDCSNKQAEIVEMKENLSSKDGDLKSKMVQVKGLLKQVSQLETELTDVKQSSSYKRLQKKEQEIREKDKIIRQHLDNGCELKISELNSKVKLLQTQISNQKNTIEELRETRRELNNEVTYLRKEADNSAAQLLDLQNEEKILVTKVGNRFTDNVCRCIIQLIGEVNIPANRCSPAIACISNCLFHTYVDMKDLPSQRTNLRYTDQGHILAKYHITDAIKSAEVFDMHNDGTTRDHRKYLGTQVTLSDRRVMSLGYTTVQTEDAQTLLDCAVALLQELVAVHDDDDTSMETNFREILTKLNGLMSDRASVNKAFNKAMNEKRSTILNDENLKLEFVYCNAHFLLGLSSEGEKIMKDIEKGIGDGKLGRDRLNTFRNWSSSGESAVARLIRTGSDVLGPRGDDKSSCRDSWEAYCSLKGINSYIKSYRSNRFNNYFEGAASLHYHREAVQELLSNYFTSPNLKLQSVLADSQSDELDTLLCAVGITYFVLTGPYWQLVTSQIEYLDLYKYITPMRE